MRIPKHIMTIDTKVSVELDLKKKKRFDISVIAWVRGFVAEEGDIDDFGVIAIGVDGQIWERDDLTDWGRLLWAHLEDAFDEAPMKAELVARFNAKIQKEAKEEADRKAAERASFENDECEALSRSGREGAIE